MSIDINLLPWREQQREQRQRRFYLALAGGVLVGLLGGLGLTYHYTTLERAQQQRNAHIVAHLGQLEGDIRQVDEHAAAGERLSDQVRVFSALQQDRLQTVRLFHALTLSLVDGVHYTQLSREEDQLSLVGRANSNGQVSEQMRALAAVPGISELLLSAVEADGGERRRFSFGMTQLGLGGSGEVDDAEGDL